MERARRSGPVQCGTWCRAARTPNPTARRHVAMRRAAPADPASAAAAERPVLLLQPHSNKTAPNVKPGADQAQKSQTPFLQRLRLTASLRAKGNVTAVGFPPL